MPDFGVVIFESRHAPGFSSSVLKQDFSEFLLVIAGQARLEGGGRSFNLWPDSLIHTPANTEYRYEDMPGRPVTLYAIQYRDNILPARLNQPLAGLGILHWNLRRAVSPLLRTFRSTCKEMLYEQFCHQIDWQTVLLARLLDLVVRTARFASRRAPFHQPSLEKPSNSVHRVVNYVMRLESEFFLATTLDEAAGATGLGRRRFTALFRSITGQSWHKHLMDLRLNHARELLSRTDKTILAVAFETGFEDLSNFNHVFKQAFGCSPSAFRNK